jgi:hypothetical protein
MNFRTIVILAAVAAAAWSQNVIRLKTRDLPHAASSRMLSRLPERPAGQRQQHYILSFRTAPSPALRRELERRGMRVVASVPDSALMVTAAQGADVSGLDVVWAGALDARDKLSPLVATVASGYFLVVFHPDVPPERARELTEQNGLAPIENPDLLPGHMLAAGSYRAVNALAAADEVAYVMPASPDLVAGNPVAGCAGAAAETGMVGEYVRVGTGWSKDSTGVAALKYFFQSLTEKLPEATARTEMERALNEWQRYSGVRFSAGDRADGLRTIAIRFARRDHGDGYPFDGRGATLAHTFYPSPPNSETLAGDMHLDGDEEWRVGAATDLFSVALHELGHALGLGHSDKPGSVMYPYYRYAAGLTDDDIAGIQAIYPLIAGTTPPATPPATTPANPGTPVTPVTPAKPTDTIPPSVKIVSPGASIVSTSAQTIRISGTASDSVGVTAVKYSNSTGAAGTAAGTLSWLTDVPLLVGNNVVTIRAWDAAGNSGWRSITVVRR